MAKNISPFIMSISKVISGFFNPLVSLLIYFLYYSSKHYTPKETLENFIPILLILMIPVTIWIFRNVRKGRYSNFDVSDRNQRKSLYFFVAGCLIIYLLYDKFVNGNIDLVMIFALVLLLVMQFSNYFIKSSMHTAFNIFVAALFFSQNPVLGAVWFCIAVLVGTTRVILQKHTVREVFSGGIIAFIISFIYLYANIQIQH